MGMSNAAAGSVLALIFNATAWSNYADNASSSPQTNVDVALHTADPGASGNMSTNEIAYTSYARVSVARTSSGWALSGETISPVATIAFPAGTGGSGTATHFSVGKTGGGSAAILFSGTISPNIVCGSGITPQLSTATTITLG